MIKSFESLTIVDDFMFSKVMRDLELCKTMIERLLGIKVEKLEPPLYQKTIKVTRRSKGVRLDVYVHDNKKTMYDLEMQAYMEKYLPQRSRYYQDMMDMDQIDAGDPYRKLRKNIVIFICRDDLFGRGLPIYTFVNRCREDSKLELNDGTMKVFVNASYVGTDINPQLKSLLDYIAGSVPTDEYTERLDEAVNSAKTNEEWRLEYMTYETRLMDRFEDGLEQGREEGREEGLEQGREEVAKNLLKDGELSIEKIAVITGVDSETLERLREEVDQ